MTSRSTRGLNPVVRLCRERFARAVKRRVGRGVTVVFVKPETESFYEAAVRRAVDVIVGSLDEALDLAAIARTAALSPFHFHRVFRGMLGETPLELHRRLRMERAATQLGTTEDAVTNVAFAAGYDTHEAFTRAFRAAFGNPPSTFRQLAREAAGCGGRLPQSTLAARNGIHFAKAIDLGAIVAPSKGANSMDVTIESLPARRVATVRHTGPYTRISEAFARLGAAAGPAGLIGRPGSAMIALYHDDPETTPADQLRSDAGLIVDETVALPSGLVEVRLPAGRYARTTHRGPYPLLGDAWARFMGQWLPGSGHRIGDGVPFERYHNTQADVAPEDLVTDLYVPIA